MPTQKRASSGPSPTASAAKKSRASTGSTASPQPSPSVAGDGASRPPRSKRWAALSASGNSDSSFRLAMYRDPVAAYEWVCFCRGQASHCDESDGEDEDEDDEDVDGGGRAQKPPMPPCDGGQTCLCMKPASAAPAGHPWIQTYAGARKYFVQRDMINFRDPDSFGMYTFNDHFGYGILEIIQNLVLDFDEASANWKEQWAVCEGLAYTLNREFVTPFFGIDHGECVTDTTCLLGRLFLAMLARLERQGLISPTSEVRNLGMVMSMFIRFAQGARAMDCLEGDAAEALGPKADKKTFSPHVFDAYIVAYADKYGIPLVGPHNIATLVAQAQQLSTDAVDLPVPASNAGEKADPFGWGKALKKYKGTHTQGHWGMGRAGTKNKIGGDYYDITTWSPADRKKYAFDKGKDPFGKQEIEALKKGLVMCLG